MAARNNYIKKRSDFTRLISEIFTTHIQFAGIFKYSNFIMVRLWYNFCLYGS